jgi:D-inositol-3-phosphate glycosyltransferase
VLATRIGGITSMVRDQVTGVIVDAGNPRALSETLEHLLKDRELRRQLSTNALAKVAKYSWGADEFHELYRENMAAGRR